MKLFGRDAEHYHPVDTQHLESKVRILDGGLRKGVGVGLESRQGVPERKISGLARPEHPVYGRR
jgi:hypothetical protein